MKLNRLFLVLSILLSLTMLAMVADRVDQAWRDVGRANQGRDAVLLLQDMLVAAEMASRERGPSNALLGSEPSEYPLRKEKLKAARDRTDAAFSALNQRLQNLDMQERPAHLAYIQAAAYLQAGREAIDTTLGSHDSDRIRAAIEKMFAVIGALEPGLLTLSNEAQAAFPGATDAVLGAVLAARMRETAGRLGSQFTVALATHKPIRKEEHDDIQQLRGRIEQLREVLLWRTSALMGQAAVRQAREAVQVRYFESAIPFTQAIEAASLARKPYPVDAAGFAAAYVPDMDAIVELRNVLMKKTLADSEAERDKRMDEAVRMIGGSLLMVAVLGCTLWLLHARVVRPLARSTDLIVAIAQGRLDEPIPESSFRDEIAELFHAIGVLRDNSRARVELERERLELIDKLRARSNTDYLTGLPNRRGFYELAEHDLPKLLRHQFPLTLAIFDVDHFKRVNDRYGHAVGDAVLVEICRLCQTSLRRGDVVARFGGEEFMLWMPYCELVQGVAKVEALRQAIEDMQIELPGGGNLSVTASFGVADWTDGYASIDHAISRADELLYAAKAAGRNRVMVAGRH